MEKGIAVAGNLIVDNIKEILRYPQKKELTYILSIDRAMGGAVCNVICDLARMDPELPLSALGLIGEDANGDFILEQFGAHKNIDSSGVLREGITSFTDVMTESVSKERTFFNYGGASSKLSREHFDLDVLQADIFHIGYILLLESLDGPDPDYGTQMAHLLHDVQKKGIATSIDIVSQSGAPFSKIVPPALRYADYCVINEFEAQCTTGIELRDSSEHLIEGNMQKALEALKRMGVSRWAVIHAPESSFGIDERGEFMKAKSLKLPEGFIAGSVGAGDAFCAGVLYSAYSSISLGEALELGAATAACSLSKPGASEGVPTVDEIRAFAEKYR